MPGSDESERLKETAEREFLAAEYHTLITLDGARNDRLDRLLTTFVSLAAAPWAVYALTVKEHSGLPSFSDLPLPVFAAFVLIGLLGTLVAMMYIQVWFNIVMYMRAVNAIRSHFLRPRTLSFHLPLSSEKPPYYNTGSYIQFALIGMAVVNSVYIGLGFFAFDQTGQLLKLQPGRSSAILAGLWWVGQMSYFYWQGRKRESHSKGPSLSWRK